MNNPSYLNLIGNKEFDSRIDKAYEILKKCTLCPNQCKINRSIQSIQKGKCRSGMDAVVASFNPHHGEEPPISGIYGSGTVFFANCTLQCMFCQNYPISQLGNGNPVSINDLADIFLYLQNKKCHNLNLVTPTHFVPQILKALKIAVKKSFKLPIVYNTSGYECIETLNLMDGVVDIYLPDMKYGCNENALQYSGIKKYFDYNKAAIKEIFRQVGPLKTDRHGIAVKGLIIRHLVLPYKIAESKKILQFLKDEVSTQMTIGIMAQYFPAYKAVDDKKMKHRLTGEEYKDVVNFAKELEFENLLTQDL